MKRVKTCNVEINMKSIDLFPLSLSWIRWDFGENK